MNARSWLVTDEQGLRDRRDAVVELDDADRVGQMVDDPDLVVVACRDGDRLEADADRSGRRQLAVVDAKHLESVVGGVRREQHLARGCEGERSHL
jgi:hypothetical protein